MTSDPATRLRLDVAQPRPAEPVRGQDISRGCQDPACPVCAWTGSPCREWLVGSGRWCVRCGWEERYHPTPQDLDADRYRWGHT